MRETFYDIDSNAITISELPELPSWLMEALPAPDAPLILHVGSTDEAVLLRFPDESETEFPSLNDALETIDNSELKIRFSDEFRAREDRQGNLMAQAVFVRSNSKSSRLLIEDYDAASILDLRESYHISQQAIDRFLAKPSDYFLAWDFIDKHPAFWLNNDIERFPYHWETDNGTQQMSQYVYQRNGETIIRLELGGHISPTYKHTYGDYRLHPTGRTQEEALLKLAKRVHLVFHRDGTDRDIPDEVISIEEDLVKNIARFVEGENHG